jgi:hypothetical protein
MKTCTKLLAITKQKKKRPVTHDIVAFEVCVVRECQRKIS